MPLVRIDIQQGRTEPQLRELADAVHDVMLQHFAAPAGDRYQVITEHPAGRIIAEDTGLGLSRTNEIVLIQIFHQGRDRAQKEKVYAELARGLSERVGLDPQDLIVTMSENTKEDWSFGHGRAQFLTGEL